MFPKLQSEEVAVLFCEYSTGHVLNNDLQLRVNNQQDMFTVLPSLKEAIIFANTVVSQKTDVECIIYGADNAVLHKIHSL